MTLTSPPLPTPAKPAVFPSPYLHPLDVGSLHLKNNLLLAPIAGYCDLAYRLVVRARGGVGLAFTDLLCPEGILRQSKRTLELSATCPEDSPLGIQLYGSQADRLTEAARWAEDQGAHVIDLNMGCPVDKITKNDGGSKLLCHPDSTLRLVQRLLKCLRHTPLTCKLRLGWDDTSIVAPYLAKRLEELGVAMITIHGRTTAMRFSGKARLEGIAEVVNAVQKIPVIGNGDICTPADVVTMFEKTGCAGVMVGREAISQPWIFHDIELFLRTGVVPPPPTVAEKCQMMRDHFYNILRLRTERVAICTFRKRVSWYAKTMHPCREMREAMHKVGSPADFEGILRNFVGSKTSQTTPFPTSQS